MSRRSQNSPPFRSEFWGICCESGKKYSQVVKDKFHLSMAALDPTVNGTSARVSLLVERGGCEYLLCNLTPDSILQVSLNLFFDIGEKLTFSLKGQGTVHLSGYHIFPENNNSGLKDSSSAYSSLKKNSLDSDLDEETDTSEEYEGSTDDEEEEEEDDDDDDDDLEEEIVAKSKKYSALAKGPALKSSTPAKRAQTQQATSNKKDTTPKFDIKSAALKTIRKDKKALNSLKSKRSLEMDSSDEDEESGSNSSADVNAQRKLFKKDFQAPKRLKATPTQVSREPAHFNSRSGDSSGELNSSIGRTPMPKKSATLPSSLTNASAAKNLKNKARAQNMSSDDDSDIMEVANKSKPSGSEQLNTSATSTESKKKRRKKKKKSLGANDGKVTESNTPVKQNESTPAFKSAKKLAGGLEYEDIRVGQGLEAKKGKLVHVYYTGKLENNKVFDSRQPGSKPFSFKLGSGQVIKGWDLGLEGMKVGGKRRLRIPPHMGYRNQQTGDIPPSSTLHFVVELKAVS